MLKSITLKGIEKSASTILDKSSNKESDVPILDSHQQSLRAVKMLTLSEISNVDMVDDSLILVLGLELNKNNLGLVDVTV